MKIDRMEQLCCFLVELKISECGHCDRNAGEPGVGGEY